MSAEERLIAMGIELPPVHPPSGLYEDAVLTGQWMFLSGKGPRRADGSRGTGKVDIEISLQDAREHARIAGLALLAVMRRELGSLDRVQRIVKLFGAVNSSAAFTDHPKVIDGCSELLLQVFGPERGAHARTAIGVAALPGNISVEIEMVIEVAQ